MELVHTTGKPIAQVTEELGIYDSTLGNWAKQDRIDRGDRDGLTSTNAPGYASSRPRTPEDPLDTQ